MVKVDRKIRWHYTTTILRLRIGARLTRYRNCKFHDFARTISRHADGVSRYSVPPSAGPLLPLPLIYTGNGAYSAQTPRAEMTRAQTHRAQTPGAQPICPLPPLADLRGAKGAMPPKMPSTAKSRQLLGDGSAPGPRWGTSVPQTPPELAPSKFIFWIRPCVSRKFHQHVIKCELSLTKVSKCYGLSKKNNQITRR